MRFPISSKVLTTTILFLVFNIACFSQQPYLLDNTTIVHRLDTHVAIFIDSSGSVSIDQVTRPDFQHHFRPNKSNLTFGYLESPIWLKISTRTLSPHTQWYLTIPAPYLEYVDFYQWRHSGTWHHATSGYFRPQSVREISHTGHVLPLQFTGDSISTVYIRIAGLSPKTFPLYAIEKDRFIEKTRFEDLGYGIFFGVLIVMFFYNLFIYLILKQENYLLYFCTIVCTFIIFSAVSGYGGKFLWPEKPMINYFAGKLSIEVLLIFLAIFTIRFLEVKRYSLIMYYALLLLIPLAVIAMILVATQTLASAGNNLITISTILFMTTGIVCLVKGNKTATYFIAAWIIYLIGGLLLTMRNSGILDYNFWTTHFVEVGAVLETTIIGFALGDRYRRYKREKEEAQLLALKVQQEATGKLEIKVKERTSQLSDANEELQIILESNKLQTRVIENKNAELDTFFYRISHDLKGPISSLLGLSFLAKMEIKDEKALEYFDRQHSQVERLNNIISGLINLTKLNYTEQLQKERIDFDKMIDECIATFSTLSNFASLTFKKEIQPGIEFYSEWTLLNGILQNLIENSIKYAREQSPFVHIIIRAEPGWIIIEVADNGQGIPLKHQSKIFEIFFRATQKASGSGLGLYILKRSVDRLKGTIQMKSEVDVGSSFTVRLPSQDEQAAT